MEVIRCRVLRAHYCIWLEDGNFQVEDVEAKKRLSVSKAQLNWFVESIAALMGGTEDGFFHNFGELDRGRMEVSKSGPKLDGYYAVIFGPKLNVVTPTFECVQRGHYARVVRFPY